MALALQDVPGEAWSLAQLELTLRTVPTTREYIDGRTWRNIDEFLTDVAQNSGVLAPYDGQDAPWRFLHRQFRELLAAQELWAEGKGERELLSKAAALADTGTNRDGELGHWAEVLGFACEISEKPLELLGALRKASRDLAMRVLLEAEGIDPLEALDQHEGIEEWDGSFLASLVERWKARVSFEAGGVRSWLYRQVTRDRTTKHLAYLYHALASLDGGVDRRRFFSLCGRVVDDMPTLPAMVDVPVHGSGRGGLNATVIRMGAFPVTNREYEAF